MPTFTYQKIRFHYQDEGSGIPFVFQHGLGADLGQPFELMPPLPGYRRIAFDCRAHGRTHPVGPLEEITLATFADDLLALLDELRIERAVVGGISMGAAVTLNFCLRYPDNVAGLILSRPAWLDAPNPWNVQMFTIISSLIRQHGATRGKELFEETPEYKEALARWPAVAQSLAGQFDDPEVEQTAFKFERIIKDCPNRDRREWAQIKVPTLILANGEDPIHPLEYGQTLARSIPGAEWRELTPKTQSVEQHDADVRRALETFLQKHRKTFGPKNESAN